MNYNVIDSLQLQLADLGILLRIHINYITYALFIEVITNKTMRPQLSERICLIVLSNKGFISYITLTSD